MPHPRQARLRTVPPGGLPVALDGAWWPRTDDLPAELPSLLASVPHGWRGIASASVDGELWQPMPGRVLIGSHVVRLHRARVARDPHTICLLAPGHGRWDLLVVPPGTPPAEAASLMDRTVGGRL
ncbi:hypothetical protein GBW32_09250 [Streptomyces tsukubensis]|uniref:Uncharacterized protein n=1 Tax=Streptomyces tsukubensis TaxID=83656 RepID=A0A1V3ZZF2_9ACTN|nr:hypothetical protein B1H18_33275 [Streptomyces tsukubensis]QFR97619.1 hypothetical protein GBW32_09250 [Streptomyces tsukubensis]